MLKFLSCMKFCINTNFVSCCIATSMQSRSHATRAALITIRYCTVNKVKLWPYHTRELFGRARGKLQTYGIANRLGFRNFKSYNRWCWAYVYHTPCRWRGIQTEFSADQLCRHSAFRSAFRR